MIGARRAAVLSNTLLCRDHCLQLGIHISDLEDSVHSDTSNSHQYSCQLIDCKRVMEDDKTAQKGNTELRVTNHVIANHGC